MLVDSFRMEDFSTPFNGFGREDEDYDQQEDVVIQRREVEEDEIIGISEDFVSPVVSKKRKKRNQEDPEVEQKVESEEKKAKRLEDISAKFAGDLVQASRTGDFDAMKELLVQGADVNGAVCGCTALMYAAFYGREEMAKHLLSLGAKPDVQNLTGITACMWAVERGHVSIVDLLLKSGANSNLTEAQGLTALHKATRLGNLRIVSLLVEIGKAKINQEASEELDRCTPLQDAAAAGKTDVVKYLVEREAKVNQKNKQGKTALHRACCKNQSSTVECLLKIADLDVDERDVMNRTSLHWAAFFGHLETVKTLISFGADVNAKDKSNQTPIDIAKAKRFNSIVKTLTF